MINAVSRRISAAWVCANSMVSSSWARAALVLWRQLALHRRFWSSSSLRGASGRSGPVQPLCIASSRFAASVSWTPSVYAATPVSGECLLQRLRTCRCTFAFAMKAAMMMLRLIEKACGCSTTMWLLHDVRRRQTQGAWSCLALALGWRVLAARI